MVYYDRGINIAMKSELEKDGWMTLHLPEKNVDGTVIAVPVHRKLTSLTWTTRLMKFSMRMMRTAVFG